MDTFEKLYMNAKTAQESENSYLFFNEDTQTIDEAVGNIPVESRLFYPGGDAPRPEYEGNLMERSGQALADVGRTATSLAAGGAAGIATAIPDLIALAGGVGSALFPGDKGRAEAFVDTVTGISERFGSEFAINFATDLINKTDLSEEQRQMLADAFDVGTVAGLPFVPQAAKAVARGARDYAAGAPERVAERATGTTLTSGVDPTSLIDDVIVSAGGRAVRPAKTLDEAKAAFETSPNDPVLRKQYLDLRRARDAELSQMSNTEQLKLDTSYRMQHQPRGPQDGGGRLDDVTAGGELFPEDVYSADGLRFYGNPKNLFDRQSHAAILAARDNPEAEITIYRGVPKDVDQINAGDWVTLSPEYARIHAADGYGPNGDEAGKVISMKVKVKDVFSDGNDLNEFGYFPEDLAELGVKKVVPPKEDEPGIIAFHGSGADFDEFRLEMIGTGEGAQAYGYGLYFTDNEDIAKFYRNSVGGANVLKRAEDIKIANPDGGQEAVANFSGFRKKFANYYGDNAALFADRYLGQFSIDPDASEDVLIQRATDTMNAVQESDKVPNNPKEILSKITLPEKGKMYKVGLAPKPDELLDYDLPLSQQPKMLKLIDDVHGDSEIIIQQAGLDPATATGGDFVKALGGIGTEQGARAASEFLAKAGIPGIKYATNDTRSKQFNLKLDVRGKPYRDTEPIYARNLDDAKRIEAEYKEKGFGVQIEDIRKSNYVIFDDKAVKILEKYGIAGPVAVTATAVGMKQEEQSNGNTS